MTHWDRSWRGWRFYGTPVETSKDVVWQSADGRLTSDHCRVTVQQLFSKFLLTAWNVEKTLFDSRQTVTWPPFTVAWPFSDFCFDLNFGWRFYGTPIETSKDVVWQSADGRLTSDHCRVTVQRLFSKFSQIAWNVQKTLFDSRPTVAWPPTTVAWLFSDFFQKNSQLLETSKRRCLTASRRSRDLRPLSRDRSATFFKIFPNCLKRPKNVVWQSADGRVTSDHCRVTVQRLFSKFSQSLETSKKRCLTVGRRLRDLRPLSRDCSANFFKKISNCLKRPKTLFDSQPTVAWPPTTVAWPFSDFFQNFPKSLETSKYVVWQSADGRVTSDHCLVTVQRLFSKFSQIAWNVQIRCLTVGRRSRDLRPLSRDRSATFFKISPNCLKRPKNVVWQPADGRVTSDYCRVTIQRLFSKFYQIAWNVQKTLFDSRLTVAWPPTTVAWPFSDFFKKFLIAWNVEKSLFDSRPTVAWPPTTVAWLFSDFFNKIPNGLKRRENVDWQSADGRLTSDNSCVTFQRLSFHISP